MCDPSRGGIGIILKQASTRLIRIPYCNSCIRFQPHEPGIIELSGMNQIPNREAIGNLIKFEEIGIPHKNTLAALVTAKNQGILTEFTEQFSDNWFHFDLGGADGDMLEALILYKKRVKVSKDPKFYLQGGAQVDTV